MHVYAITKRHKSENRMFNRKYGFPSLELMYLYMWILWFTEMEALMVLRRRAAEDRRLVGARIVGCTHITAQAAVSYA